MSRLENQSAVAGSPGVLEVGGRTLLVCKPSPRDLLVMQKWLLSRPVEDEDKGLTSAEMAGLSPEDKLLLIREYAKAKRGKRSPTEGEVINSIYSVEGVVMQLWLACRKHQPGIQKADIEPLVTAENYDDVLTSLDASLLAAEDTPDPKSPAGPPSSAANAGPAESR